MLTEPRKISRIRRSERSTDIRCRATYVISVGGKGVRRGTGLSRHHVEESIDQRPIVIGHVRASASAAIILAVKPCPVRLRAATA